MQDLDRAEQPSSPRIRRLDYEPLPGPQTTSGSCPTCGGDLAEPEVAPSAAPTVVTVDLPRDPVLLRWVEVVLVIILEGFDGRRPLPQLGAIADPPVLRYLRAAGVHRPGRVSRLRSVRVCQPADGVAEVAAVVQIGGRPRALAARFERRSADQWHVTVLRLL